MRPDRRNHGHKKKRLLRHNLPQNNNLQHWIQLFFYRQTLKLQAELLKRKQDREKEYRFTAFTGDI
jgi:hypothetical protein